MIIKHVFPVFEKAANRSIQGNIHEFQLQMNQSQEQAALGRLRQKQDALDREIESQVRSALESRRQDKEGQAYVNQKSSRGTSYQRCAGCLNTIRSLQSLGANVHPKRHAKLVGLHSVLAKANKRTN